MSHPDPAATPPTDRQILDSIALLMACTPDWGPDVLDAIADSIEISGRPHPGSAGEGLPDTDDWSEQVARIYQQQLDARNNPGTGSGS